MRRFKTQTCDRINTFELDREVGARARRLARENPASPPSAGGKKPKTFNLFTYKFHALGDYVSSIRWFGTTDSYSTQTVSGQCLCFVFPQLILLPSLNSSIVLRKPIILELARTILQNSSHPSNVGKVICTISLIFANEQTAAALVLTREASTLYSLRPLQTLAPMHAITLQSARRTQ